MFSESINFARNCSFAHHSRHWNPAEPAHDRSQGRDKKGTLRKEGELYSEREKDSHSQRKIPVGSVRRHYDHEFRIIRERAFDLPPEPAKNRSAKGARDFVPTGRQRRRKLERVPGQMVIGYSRRYVIDAVVHAPSNKPGHLRVHCTLFDKSTPQRTQGDAGVNAENCTTWGNYVSNSGHVPFPPAPGSPQRRPSRPLRPLRQKWPHSIAKD